MSANTGVAPTSMITFAVATHELGVVMTSSPGPMPAMRKAISIVQVPELKVRTGRPEKNSDSRDSNAFTFGPLLVNQPERRTSVTPAMVASSMEGRVKGRKGNAAASVMGASPHRYRFRIIFTCAERVARLRPTLTGEFDVRSIKSQLFAEFGRDCGVFGEQAHSESGVEFLREHEVFHDDARHERLSC